MRFWVIFGKLARTNWGAHWGEWRGTLRRTLQVGIRKMSQQPAGTNRTTVSWCSPDPELRTSCKNRVVTQSGYTAKKKSFLFLEDQFKYVSDNRHRSAPPVAHMGMMYSSDLYAWWYSTRWCAGPMEVDGFLRRKDNWWPSGDGNSMWVVKVIATLPLEVFSGLADDEWGRHKYTVLVS